MLSVDEVPELKSAQVVAVGVIWERPQSWPVTVAVAVALSLVLATSLKVPVAVPMLVTVPFTPATLVNVSLVPGANGPNEPMLPFTLSVTDPDTLKKSLLFVTT